MLLLIIFMNILFRPSRILHSIMARVDRVNQLYQQPSRFLWRQYANEFMNVYAVPPLISVMQCAVTVWCRQGESWTTTQVARRLWHRAQCECKLMMKSTRIIFNVVDCRPTTMSASHCHMPEAWQHSVTILLAYCQQRLHELIFDRQTLWWHSTSLMLLSILVGQWAHGNYDRFCCNLLLVVKLGVSELIYKIVYILSTYSVILPQEDI